MQTGEELQRQDTVIFVSTGKTTRINGTRKVYFRPQIYNLNRFLVAEYLFANNKQKWHPFVNLID